MKELNRNKMAGMTAAGWMIVIAVVLFFVYLAIKLIPAYIEHGNVKGVMESVQKLQVANSNNREISKKFKDKLGFARLGKLITEDSYKVTQDVSGKYLEVKYDKKIAMFGNMFVLIEFEHKQKL